MGINEVKESDIPQILRGLLIIERGATDDILLNQRILRKVVSARKRLLLKFPFSKNVRVHVRRKVKIAQ